MNRMKFLIAAFAFGMIASVGQTVNAATPTNIECESITGGSIHEALCTLCKATKETWFKNDQDKDGLVAKIYGAGIKVEQNKIEEAVKKLGEFDAKLTLLTTTCKKINCTEALKIQEALTVATTALDGL